MKELEDPRRKWEPIEPKRNQEHVLARNKASGIQFAGLIARRLPPTDFGTAVDSSWFEFHSFRSRSPRINRNQFEPTEYPWKNQDVESCNK